MTDRHAWKHYLPATSFADGKNYNSLSRSLSVNEPWVRRRTGWPRVVWPSRPLPSLLGSSAARLCIVPRRVVYFAPNSPWPGKGINLVVWVGLLDQHPLQPILLQYKGWLVIGLLGEFHPPNHFAGCFDFFMSSTHLPAVERVFELLGEPHHPSTFLQ